MFRAYRGVVGLSVEAICEIVGVAPMTWRRFEDGYILQPRSYATIEKAVGLASGSLNKALCSDNVLVTLAEHLDGATLVACDKRREAAQTNLSGGDLVFPQELGTDYGHIHGVAIREMLSYVCALDHAYGIASDRRNDPAYLAARKSVLFMVDRFSYKGK